MYKKTEKKPDYLQYYSQHTLRLACSLFGDYMRCWGDPFPDGVSTRAPHQREVQRVVALQKRLEERSHGWLGRTLLREQSSLEEEIIALLDDILSPHS